MPFDERLREPPGWGHPPEGNHQALLFGLGLWMMGAAEWPSSGDRRAAEPCISEGLIRFPLDCRNPLVLNPEEILLRTRVVPL